MTDSPQTSRSLLHGGKILLAICAFAFLGAWWTFFGEPVRQSEIPGVYQADYNTAKERLVLERSGTFVQEVALKSSDTTTLGRGMWDYDPNDGYIRFDGTFMLVMDRYGKIDTNYAMSKDVHVAFPLIKRFGRIRIIGGEEPPQIYYEQ